MNGQNNQNQNESGELEKRVSSGLLWMILSTLIAKGGSFAAQIVLGWILLKEDFGIYAIAISISSFIQVLKDGGTRKIIVQKGARRFNRLCPDVFWMASAFNIFAALVMLSIMVPVARIYDEPQLVPMLIILALSTLLGTPDTMYRSWLSVQLRFRELARLQTMLGLARSLSMILLAVGGAGVQSFAWPALVAVLCGWAIGHRMCGPLPIWKRPRFRVWPILFGTSLWMFVGSGALMMLRQGPYMILGLFHNPALIGVYFFAFQLLLQINQMIAVNFQSVLLPTLSSMEKNVDRHSSAVIRASGALALIGTTLALGVGVGIGDLVRVVWNDKWIDAIPAVQWMALFFPMRMLQSIFEPALISRGLYRKWALLVVIQAFVVLVSTLIAASFFATASGFAMSIGIGFCISMFIASSIGMGFIGISHASMAKAVLPVWALGSIVYAGVLYARHMLGWEASNTTPNLIAHGVISGTVFILSFIVIVRLFTPNSITQVIRSVPNKHARLLRKFLFL